MKSRVKAERVDTASVVPDPDAVLADYPARYLTCRADRHQWQRAQVWKLIAAGTAERETICTDCGTSKVAIVNTHGWYQVGPVRYRYPNGYTTRRTGLTLGDFRSRAFREDFARAERRGEVGQ